MDIVMNTIKKVPLSRLTPSILVAMAALPVHANDGDQNDALNQSAAALNLADEAKQAFYEDSSSKLHSFLYIRDRQQKDDNGEYVPNIENQTLQFAWDYRSGYFKDTVGIDIWANTNLQLGETTGMSEILYFDHTCENNSSYDGKACEKSYVAVPVVSLKAKFGDDKAGLALRGGYTRINIGTIRSSWGLNPHAYRGLEAKAHFGDFVVGYAIADKFKNDWRKNFHDMTTTWHQNQHPGGKQGQIIDYIHTVGGIYKFDGGQIDLGYGEGKNYRTNWQVLGQYGFDMGNAKVNLTGFYHGSIRAESELTGLKDQQAQRYVGLGANIKSGNFTWIAGFSATDTKGQEVGYNFRLTPWANSDNRNFQQTASQLEDYNVDGTKAAKLAVNYNFADFGVAGLTAGLGANYGTHVRSSKTEKEYDGTMHSLDWNLGYQFLDGGLKGLNVRLFHGMFRGNDVVHKQDRNDVKLLISYSLDLK
ncbi:OprD family porin [Vibrio sp. S9_S30]|nr:OprD family porin [Vibrio sp. S9_S30]